MGSIYLDYNATTPLDLRAYQAMKPFLKEYYGNPSCVYKLGQTSAKAVAQGRKSVADLLNCHPEEIVFTSGGTESNNYAIQGAVRALRKKGHHIITSQVEHPSVLKPCEFLEKEGFSVTYLPVDEFGRVRLEDVQKAITKKTILISLMWANNEVGTLQPIGEVGALARRKGILFHSDGAQAVGKIPVDVRACRVDLLTLASHKIYGPKGMGALYIRKGKKIQNLFYGASHEGGRRPGTENVPAIVGLGKACALAKRELTKRARTMKQARDHLEKILVEKIPHCQVQGPKDERLPNTLSISFKGIKAHQLLEKIAKRVAASPGAACHGRGRIKTSHVLKAMKVPPAFAHGTFRLSTGKDTTLEDVEKAARVIICAVEELGQ